MICDYKLAFYLKSKILDHILYIYNIDLIYPTVLVWDALTLKFIFGISIPKIIAIIFI